MAVHNPNYEVPWQLPEDDYGGEDAAAKPGGTALDVEERSSSLARFGALLAGADFAAVVVCGKESMTVELADPPTPWLPPGLVLANERSLGRRQRCRNRTAGRALGVVGLSATQRLSQCRLDHRTCVGPFIKIGVRGEQ